MGRRIVAFLAAALGGGIELFGAVYGQGVMGSGMFFGLAGTISRGEAAIVGLALGTATIVAAVGLMLVRETRWLALGIGLAAVLGTVTTGPVFGIGAGLALVGGVLAWRVDREAPLV